MKELLNPKTCGKIAIVGLSPDESKDSYKVAKYLIDNGFKILPIYPHKLLQSKKILDLVVWDNLTECAKNNEIEIVVMFRKSEFASTLAEEIINNNIKIKCFWMQLGLQNANARKILETNGIKVIEDKCIKIEYRDL